MSRSKFAKYTEKIRSMLPTWFQMKKQPNDSLGLQFLNFFGLELDDIKKMLDYAYKQTKIETIDESFIDIVYKAILPTYFDMTNLVGVSTSSTSLKQTDKLYDFFGLAVNYDLDEGIHQPDYYFVDTDRKIIYVREDFDKMADNPYGQIVIHLKDGSTQTMSLALHHVWNFFDEFGALLACPRLFGENNSDYKLRILDVFINPANSTKFGLANGVARELGIREHKVWLSPATEDFIIKDKMVIANMIEINGKTVDIENVYTDVHGYLVIQKMPYETGVNYDISYIRGIEMRALTDHKDNKFSNETYKANGQPTDLMLEYVRNIKNNSSIIWGDFKYNEGMWVKDDTEFEDHAYGFVPATFDSNIKGFAKFGFFNKGEI
jgi:hypothetical protein